MGRLRWLEADSPADSFPPVETALAEPNGLLAAGGDLSVGRVLTAYRHGIFPWYERDQPILWWSPDPRTIIRPENLHLSRTTRRHMRRSAHEYSFNCAFGAVIDGCAAPRGERGATWITADMKHAFRRLHAEGWAHSIEIWSGEALIGGLYGLAIDRVFFGESMFSRYSNASKMALAALCREMQRRGIRMLDCQVLSAHLLTLGAETVSRRAFIAELDRYCAKPAKVGGFPKRRAAVLNLLR